MEDEFDVNAAVDEIGAGLGFEAEEAASNDVELKVELPSEKVEATVAAEPAPPATEVPATTPTSSDEASAPPKTWRPEAAATWTALPEQARQEILKREADIFKGIEHYKQDASIGKSLRAAVDPYANFLNSKGIRPMDAVQGLLQSHYQLATGSPEQKLAMLTSMAQSYGIQLGGAQSQETPPYLDPAVAALQKELQSVKSHLTEAERFRAEQVRTGIRSEVDTFAKDPANQYFDEVGNEVALLLQSGRAQTLKDAYEQAIWLNPVVRNKVMSTQRQAETQQQHQASAAKVAAVKQATAANVQTRVRSGGIATPSGSMDDTIAATLANIKARTN